jgi:hypothetical protein
MKSALLAVAIFVGIVIPGATLGLFAVEGWHLPSWLAVSLPIVLFGSVRGTLVLAGWKAFRWSLPKFKAWRRRNGESPSESASE